MNFRIISLIFFLLVYATSPSFANPGDGDYYLLESDKTPANSHTPGVQNTNVEGGEGVQMERVQREHKPRLSRKFSSENTKLINLILDNACQILEKQLGGTGGVKVTADIFQELINRTSELYENQTKLYDNLRGTFGRAKKQRRSLERKETPTTEYLEEIKRLEASKEYDPTIIELLKDFASSYELKLHSSTIGASFIAGVTMGGGVITGKTALGRYVFGGALQGTVNKGPIIGAGLSIGQTVIKAEPKQSLFYDSISVSSEAQDYPFNAAIVGGYHFKTENFETQHLTLGYFGFGIRHTEAIKIGRFKLWRDFKYLRGQRLKLGTYR